MRISYKHWNIHATELFQKLRSQIPKIKICISFCDNRQMNVIYDALVQSHLLYGNKAWGGLHNCYSKKVEIVQKWILKVMIRKTYRFPREQLFQESGVVDLRQLYFESLCIH